MKVLTVSKKAGVAEVLVGTISFYEDKPAELTLEDQGADGKQLQDDWNEVVAEGEIPLEIREVKEVDGDTVTESKALLVSPGEKDYYGAVWSYLENEYGYLVDVQAD